MVFTINRIQAELWRPMLTAPDLKAAPVLGEELGPTLDDWDKVQGYMSMHSMSGQLPKEAPRDPRLGGKRRPLS